MKTAREIARELYVLSSSDCLLDNIESALVEYGNQKLEEAASLVSESYVSESQRSLATRIRALKTPALAPGATNLRIKE